MNRHGKKSLIAIHLWLIALLASFAAVSARAQVPIPASANDDQCNTTRASSPQFSYESLGFWLMPPHIPRSYLANLVSRELQRAWIVSGVGTTAREGVVLIFRMVDGSYLGKLQPFTNQYKQCTFTWNPAAIAIVHTHPNDSDPRPGAQDRQVADKYCVPNFTITISGMYVYDPATKKTSKLLNGLDWLNPYTD